MQFSAKQIFWMAFASVALQGLTSLSWGTVPVSPADKWVFTFCASLISYFQSLVLWIIGTQGTKPAVPGSGSMVTPATTIPGKTALVVLIGAGLMLAMMLGGAQAQPKLPQFRPPLIAAQPPQLTGDLIADIKAKLGGIPDIQAKLDAIKSSLPALKPPAQTQADLDAALVTIEQIAVADLDDAVKVFDAAKNYSGKDCFGALRDVIAANVIANQAAPADVPTQGAAADVPFKHVFLAIAKIYNVMVANQPGGPVRKQCAAMKDDFANSGPGSLLLGSSTFSKVLPILKIIGIGA